MLCFRRIISFDPRQCRLKYLLEFAQGLGAHESLLGDPGLAAGRDVQHPERHFQNPTCLEVFQAAVRHRLTAFYESGMNTHRSPMPWMPRVADFPEIPNMGVVSLSCSTPREITKAKETSYSFRLGPRHTAVEQSAVESGSAA